MHRVSSASRRRKAEEAALATPAPATPAVNQIAEPPVQASPMPFSARPPSAEAGSQPCNMDCSRPGSRPGRRRAAEDTKPKPKPPEDATLEMNISRGSFGSSAGGRRPVRAKISVGGSDESSDRRPGTTDSTGKSSTAKPIWLQNDERAVPRHMSPSQGDAARGFGARPNSVDRSLNSPAPAVGDPALDS